MTTKWLRLSPLYDSMIELHQGFRAGRIHLHPQLPCCVVGGTETLKSRLVLWLPGVPRACASP